MVREKLKSPGLLGKGKPFAVFWVVYCFWVGELGRFTIHWELVVLAWSHECGCPRPCTINGAHAHCMGHACYIIMPRPACACYNAYDDGTMSKW